MRYAHDLRGTATMLLSKHLNKYYARYWYFFLIGIFSLVAVD